MPTDVQLTARTKQGKGQIIANADQTITNKGSNTMNI